MYEGALNENRGEISTGRVASVRNAGYHSAQKRAVDIILAVILFPIFFPIIALLYLIVRLDGGPGFFGHERVGRNGEIFRCWKIRTMVPDADVRLKDLIESNPHARAQWERDRKLEKDPRVTAVGRFLRKSSLDELPQIWNVLKGDMSMVGPRPVTRPEVERYGAHRFVYLSLRPGVTGLWQVSGRNDVSYEERVRLDVDYSQRMSLASDLRILVRTVGTVLGRTGC